MLGHNSTYTLKKEEAHTSTMHLYMQFNSIYVNICTYKYSYFSSSYCQHIFQGVEVMRLRRELQRSSKEKSNLASNSGDGATNNAFKQLMGGTDTLFKGLDSSGQDLNLSTGGGGGSSYSKLRQGGGDDMGRGVEGEEEAHLTARSNPTGPSRNVALNSLSLSDPLLPPNKQTPPPPPPASSTSGFRRSSKESTRLGLPPRPIASSPSRTRKPSSPNPQVKQKEGYGAALDDYISANTGSSE
jgi:hypothetical protein